MSNTLTREEALRWIKQNWDRLISENKLSKVLKKYCRVYLNSPEGVPVKGEEKLDEALKIFDGKLF